MSGDCRGVCLRILSIISQVCVSPRSHSEYVFHQVTYFHTDLYQGLLCCEKCLFGFCLRYADLPGTAGEVSS